MYRIFDNTGNFTGFSTPYSCLDRVMCPTEEWKKPRGGRNPPLSLKEVLFFFLRDRWARLFGSTGDFVLFYLTSTYFEVDGAKALDNDLQRYGYNRDKRGDCLLQTLRAIVREHAPRLTPGQIIEKFRTVKMGDVVMPTTDWSSRCRATASRKRTPQFLWTGLAWRFRPCIRRGGRVVSLIRRKQRCSEDLCPKPQQKQLFFMRTA